MLYGALKQAMRDGLIPRNPAEPIAPFKVDAKPNDHSWEPAETMRFLETARPHRLFAAFYLALATGMRHGEVLGLRWRDVEDDTLHIRQSLITLSYRVALSTPKTQRGMRRIMLDPETCAVLEARRLLQVQEQREAGESWGAPSPEFADLNFTTEQGGPIRPRDFARTWYALLDAAGVHRIRFHDMRHMHVSLLHKAGVELLPTG